MDEILKSSVLPFVYPLVVVGLILSSIERWRFVSFSPSVILLFGGYFSGYMALPSILALGLLMLLVALYVADRRVIWLLAGDRRAWLLYGAIMPLSLLIAFRVFPGVDNPLLYDGVQLGNVTETFSIYLSLDKAVLALLLWSVIASRASPTTGNWLHTLWLFPIALMTVFSLGVLFDYVKLDLKWPAWQLLITWSLGNLLVTCVVEEAFFRGILQRGISVKWQERFQYGAIAALLFVSILFGLVHFDGGWSLVIMASVAGVFYGMAYWLTGRLWVAVTLHFCVNVVHLVFFSYPSLL